MVLEEPELSVPCDDGRCHSNYISCLRALVERRKESGSITRRGEAGHSRGRDLPIYGPLEIGHAVGAVAEAPYHGLG